MNSSAICRYSRNPSWQWVMLWHCRWEVLARLRALLAIGMITRVGATVRPNTVGVSTLAAMAVPDHRIEEVATIVGEERGVNHSYLRRMSGISGSLPRHQPPMA